MSSCLASPPGPSLGRLVGELSGCKAVEKDTSLLGESSRPDPTGMWPTAPAAQGQRNVMS